MAFVLARLKLTAQARAFSGGGTAQRVGFLLAWLAALVVGLGAGRAFGVLSAERTPGADLVLLVMASAIWIGWTTIPVLMPAAADQVADPARLELFPITAQDQVVGVLLGGLIAPTALFTFLLAAGGTLHAGDPASVLVLTVLGAALFTVLCVASSRTVQALLAGVVNTRRGKDVVVLASAGVAIGIYVVSQSFDRLVAAVAGGDTGGLATVLSWLPPGAATGAQLAARDGDWLGATLRLVVVVGTIAALAALWAGAIRGRVEGKGGGSDGRAHRAATTGLRLIASPLGAVTPSVVTATASQQLRYFFFRSAKALQSMVIGIVLAGLVALGIPDDSAVMAGATVGMLIVTLTALNMFAWDGAGFAYLLQSGAPWRQVVAGKALAWLVVLVGGVTAFAIAGAFLHGTWGQLPAAWLTGLTVGIVGIGLGAVTSVYGPSSSVGTGDKPGLSSKVAYGVGLFAMFLVMLGVALGISLLGPTFGTLLVTALLFLVAAVLGVVLVRIAGAMLERDPDRVNAALNG